jgi:hypothetical protein
MENKLFEFIYETSNYATEPESIYLESPLNNDSNTPMYLNETYLQCDVFPNIYKSCRDNTE